MSAVHTRQLVSCDSDCARANACRVGGYQCTECGEWFCPDSDGGVFDFGTYICHKCEIGLVAKPIKGLNDENSAEEE